MLCLVVLRGRVSCWDNYSLSEWIRVWVHPQLWWSDVDSYESSGLYFNLFNVLNQQQELKERIERVKRSSKDGAFSSEAEFSEQMMDIRKDFVTIHGEMVLLKNYSSLNFAGSQTFYVLPFRLNSYSARIDCLHNSFELFLFSAVFGYWFLKPFSFVCSTGLVKILKKYDKRTGGLLRLPFTQLALHQPFFTTEPLTRLVRECEANLELLFPLEAEVIESSTAVNDQSSNPPLKNSSDMLAEPSATLGEETMDIYRSTLAAMRAIKGLQRASSTYNPLSLSSFYSRQDDESTGAVTAENSAANSPATLPNTSNTDEEDARSG